MKVRKYVKRMAAFAAGASMLGATLAGAMAADLSDYPAPFVDSGKFNALIVVGESAATQDVLGAIDIATSLQFASKTVKKVSGTTTVDVEGDAWQVGTSTKKLEMSENLDSGSNFENFEDILAFIDDQDLGALSDGVFENSQGTFDYDQYLYWDNVDSTQYVAYLENDDDVTADFLYIQSGDNVGRYLLEFRSSAESEITDNAGTADTTGAYLWDYEGEDIEMLGKSYSIVTARRTTSAKVNSVKLTLMGGAVRDILDEGTSKTYTVNGVDYDVTLDFVGSNSAKFTVNGEITDSLLEGNTDKLKDGSQVGVRDILAQEFAGGTRRAEFFLGAQKVVLWDTDVSDTASSKNLDVGDESIDDAAVTITGSDDNSTFKIDTIEINVTADDDFYVPAGGVLSDQMVEPQALLDSWDITYQGLTEPETEMIRLKTSGTDQYELEFRDWNSNQVTVPIAYTSGGTTISKFGDDDDDLVINESTTINKNDFLILTDDSKDAGEQPTYALRYKGSDRSTRDNPVVKFDLLTEGGRESITKSYSLDASSGKQMATLRIGGASYNVYNASTATADDFDVWVDLAADGFTFGLDALPNASASDTGVIDITTQGGAEIDLKDASGSDWVSLTISTPDSDDYDNLAPTNVVFNITASSSELSLDEWGLHNFRKPESEDNTQYAYTSMGAFMKWENPTGDPGTLDVYYPQEQALPLVFVTSGATETASGETGGVESVELTKIDVGSAVLDTDPSVDGKEMDNNLIVVGGPAINKAAARLMGLPFPSFGAASTVPENAAIIKLVEHANGNVALIVAGWRAEDSQRAARVVADYETYQEAGTLAGTEVQVSGTSLSDITVGAVVMEEDDAMMEEDDAMMEEDGDAMEEGDEPEA